MNKLVFKLFPKIPFFSLFFLLSCGVQIPFESLNIINDPLKVYFCPDHDCSNVLVQEINSSNKYVYCAFYDLDLDNVISVLSQKSKNVDVKMVIDSSTFNGKIKGSAIRQDGNSQLMHNKFCVIDGKKITTGSMNPTYNDNNKNNNNLIVINSNYIARNYADEFEELWNGEFGRGEKASYPRINLNGIMIKNFFCPEDRCADAVIDEINLADKSVYFMTFSFTNADIADAIVRKKNIKVKGIFDSSQASSKYSQFERLKGFGYDVRKNSKYKLHHKVFIIDNKTVITGSFNPTQSGDGKNDENMLVIYDQEIAGLFLEEFDRVQ